MALSWPETGTDRNCSSACSAPKTLSNPEVSRVDLWGSDVLVTTSRGLGNTLAIAEYVVASFGHFARGLHRDGIERVAGRFERRAYRPQVLAGKTVCVVGAGGIGREVGRLCAALGIRVVGTRRRPDGEQPEGFAEMAGPDRLLELLGESMFVAVCCHWTPETEGLIDRRAFAVMADGTVIVDVAEGRSLTRRRWEKPSIASAVLRSMSLSASSIGRRPSRCGVIPTY